MFCRFDPYDQYRSDKIDPRILNINDVNSKNTHSNSTISAANDFLSRYLPKTAPDSLSRLEAELFHNENISNSGWQQATEEGGEKEITELEIFLRSIPENRKPDLSPRREQALCYAPRIDLIEDNGDLFSLPENKEGERANQIDIINQPVQEPNPITNDLSWIGELVNDIFVEEPKPAVVTSFVIKPAKKRKCINEESPEDLLDKAIVNLKRANPEIKGVNAKALTRVKEGLCSQYPTIWSELTSTGFGKEETINVQIKRGLHRVYLGELNARDPKKCWSHLQKNREVIHERRLEQRPSAERQAKKRKLTEKNSVDTQNLSNK